MIKVDLITGFLGAGKTTFLDGYVRYLVSKGQRVAIIENDFGAVNVDMMLLSDFIKENCTIEMIAGACDAHCHARRFKTKLIALGMQGFDRVIIEPSGIYDVDEFFDVIREEPLERWYETGSVISIVDATMNRNMSNETKYIFATQLLCAGSILVSKADSDSNRQEMVAFLNEVLEESGGKRRVDDVVIMKPWGELDTDDYEKMAQSGYKSDVISKMWFDKREEYTSLYYMNLDFDRDKIKEIIDKLFESDEYGHIHRVKGFIGDENGWFSVNVTRDSFSIQPSGEGQKVIIVIGEKLIEEKIGVLFG